MFKKLQITMLYKPGKPKSEITSYRPLSLTSSFGKILEKIITNRVKDWCNKNDIINKQQNGFRSKRNTNGNLFKLTQSLKQNIKKGFVTSAIFLDVEKAFDQVRHTGLLHKIKKFDMDHSLLRWIKSFLSERSISKKIENIKSDFFTPKHGVPQGSSLSRILFIVYVSDIPQPVNTQATTLSQFADDIALWSYGRNTIMSECKIQKHLDKISKWCNVWRIKLNPLKNKVLNFSKRKHPLLECNIKLDSIKLKAEKSVKFLGVIFDHKFTFEDYIKDKIINTRHITSSFYSLKSKKYKIPQKTMINLYKIFIRPNFDCGSTALIKAVNKYIYKREQIQMNILRSILCLNKNINNKVVRKCANISSISGRIKQLAKTWFKKAKTNNSDIKEYITPAEASLGTPLAYINN